MWFYTLLVNKLEKIVKVFIIFLNLFTGGDPRSEFVMGGDEGSVLLARQLDWESQREYNLTISVTDGVHIVYTQVKPYFRNNIANRIS